MELITLPAEKQKPTLSEDTSSDLGESPKREAFPLDSQTKTEASDSCDVILPDRGIFHTSLGRPKILRTSEKGRTRWKYGQISIIMDRFETSPIVQEALAGPNKVS
ncbi:hypothetical protein NPIL_570651 [Nephila pilipes]|uniref:Uncharacterized protein n=1 Tax=Nephila pilipes TaxID=299642 RepID=A0A8X6NQC3_NEPPI|nr:hypothetical protein NPIL_570651 [Nephila pilipes]